MFVSKIEIIIMKVAVGLSLCPGAAKLQQKVNEQLIFVKVNDFSRTAHICIKVFIPFIKDAESFSGLTSAMNSC